MARRSAPARSKPPKGDTGAPALAPDFDPRYMMIREPSEEMAETARRALSAMRNQLTSLNGYAKAVTADPEVRVEIRAGRPCTDGKIIYMRPPIELGEQRVHDVAKCGLRDKFDILHCDACRSEEDVNITLRHEVGHIVEKSFQGMSDEDKADILKRTVRDYKPPRMTPKQVAGPEWDLMSDDERKELSEFLEKEYLDLAREMGEKRAERLAKIISYAEAKFARNLTYVEINNLVSRWLPFLFNCLEDARVNIGMYKARPGLYKQFRAHAMLIFQEGTKQDDGTFLPWVDLPKNSQIMVALMAKAMGYDYEDYFDEDVVEATNDPTVAGLVAQVQNARSARAIYKLGFPVLEAIKRLGYCRDENDEPEDFPEPPPLPTPPEDDEDAPGKKTDDEPGEPDDSDDADASEEGERADDADATDAGDDADHDADEASDDGESGEGSKPTDDDADADPTDDANGSDGEDDAEADAPDDDAADDATGDSDGSDDAEADAPDSGGENADDADAGKPASSGMPSDDGGPGDDSMPGDDDEGDGAPSVDPLEEPAEDGTGGPDPLPDEDPDWDDEDDDFDDEDDDWDHEEVDSDSGGTGNEKSGDPSDAPGPDEMGTPEEAEKALEALAGHGQNHDPMKEHAENVRPTPEELEMDRAIIQGDHFDQPSTKIFGVSEYEVDDDGPCYTRVRQSERDLKRGQIDQEQFDYEFPSLDVEESILGPALREMRVTFTNNQKTGAVRNKQSGSINARVLGRRVPVDDDRLFQKRQRPARRDYFVLLGLDCSGSTMRETRESDGKYHIRINRMKLAVRAQAELLNRMGIDFAVYAHTGNYAKDGTGLHLEIHVIKSPKQKWDDKAQRRLERVSASAANLDGHTLEYYRKVCEKQRATDKLVIYYTDGQMPAENFEEELIVLKREIKDAPRRGVKIIGIGVDTDSPKQHGLDTIQLDDIRDVPNVVKALRERLV